jgi:hypothetical protein
VGEGKVVEGTHGVLRYAADVDEAQKVHAEYFQQVDEPAERFGPHEREGKLELRQNLHE